MLRALILASALVVAGPAAAQASVAPAEPVSASTVTPAPTSASSSAGVARPNAADPELEKRLVSVTKELRCMVCQNESIADSHAPLAVDMRNEIREQLKGGMSERDVIEFMVARYGNFVRFRPPLDWTTIALWFGPALLMVVGFGVLVSQLRQRRTLAAARAMPELSPSDRAALDALAAGGGTYDNKSRNDKTGNR